jgi:hypothetical protein
MMCLPCISCNKSENAVITDIKIIRLDGKRDATITFRNKDGLTGSLSMPYLSIEEYNSTNIDKTEIGCKIGDLVPVRKLGPSLVIVGDNLPCEATTAD